MEQLAARSGLSIPRGLAGLKEKPVLHTDVINREDLTDYVLKQLDAL